MFLLQAGGRACLSLAASMRRSDMALFLLSFTSIYCAYAATP
jgi:hypothetical protein